MSDAELEAIRPISTQLIQRPFRDAAFRRRVRQAYSKTCADSGLRLIQVGHRGVRAAMSGVLASTVEARRTEELMKTWATTASRLSDVLGELPH